ncbi:MAG: hypothetical protein CMH83_16865 [Nocardioides sp.]|nr:hypothetical protein [Nocardioides sp.]
MARRVHLHVGLPKTGTTYLQTIMWHNRALLRERGLLYPGRRRLDHYNAWQQVRREGRGKPVPRKGAWTRLSDQLGRWSGDGLVSHEFFSMATPEEAARVVADLAPAEVHVVVTARAYVRQWPAMWQEALKMHYDASFDQFMADARTDRLKGAWGWASQDLPAVLERWEYAVGRERVHLVTVPAPGSPRSLLWDRWREVLDLDDTGFEMDVHYPNESLGAPQAALMRRMKPQLTAPLTDGPTKHRWVRRYLGHEVLVPQRGARFLPRPDDRAWLVGRAQEAVDAITERGYPMVGDLDDLLDDGGSAAGPEPYPDDVGPEELLDVATATIEQMVRDVRELTLERDRWRARASAPSGLRARVAPLARRLRGRGDGADHSETDEDDQP